MKINFPPVARRLWGGSAMLLTIVAALLLSGCVAPYGYEGYSRYRVGGYGYWGYPRYGHYGGYYTESIPDGSLGHGFGGHRGFHGGGHYNHGAPH